MIPASEWERLVKESFHPVAAPPKSKASAAPTLRDCNKKDWHCDFRGWPEMLQKHTSVQIAPQPKARQHHVCA